MTHHRKSMEIWRHNSFMGWAAMMQSQCTNIVASKTATFEAKKIAAEIRLKAHDLAIALKKRSTL